MNALNTCVKLWKVNILAILLRYLFGIKRLLHYRLFSSLGSQLRYECFLHIGGSPACKVHLVFVTAETPFTSPWNRSAQPNTRAMQAVWEHMRPCSTSTTSRSICTRSKGTWSTWFNVMLRFGSECAVSLRTANKTGHNTADWACFSHTESCWEGCEVPRGPSHAFLLVHRSFCNLHRRPVGPVLLLHHVQVRRHWFYLGPCVRVSFGFKQLCNAFVFSLAGVNKKQQQRSSFD